LQSLDIPKWKWDNIIMDFVTHLPKSFVNKHFKNFESLILILYLFYSEKPLVSPTLYGNVLESKYNVTVGFTYIFVRSIVLTILARNLKSYEYLFHTLAYNNFFIYFLKFVIVTLIFELNINPLDHFILNKTM